MDFISIQELSLYFGDNKILKNISLDIKKGELVTLLGPSGSGKSTLLRVLAGLEVFQEGSIFLDGVEISQMSPQDRKVGMVFQSYALFPNMTVFDNIAFGLKVNKLPKTEVAQKVTEVLKIVNLEDKRDCYPHQLSGGQQQRVSLARSLVTKPKVLLLDEPLSALDAIIRKQLQIDIRQLQKKLGITMIFVTHDQEEAMILSDRIFVMNEGEIIQQATPIELYTKPKNQFIARFIGNYNLLTSEEMKLLDPSFKLKNGYKYYAIRSETIKLTPNKEENILRLSGKIESYTVLGNIIRCYFKVGKFTMTVDLLNSEGNFAELKNKTEIFIDQDDVIPLENN